MLQNITSAWETMVGEQVLMLMCDALPQTATG